MEKLTDREEEILEFLWIEIKENKKTPNIRVLKDEPALKGLIEKKLLDLDKEGLLTEEGLEEAKLCVRRHRLAERLLADILDVKDPFIHQASCKFEHALHYGLEDNICTLLGHPKTCPHGKSIPEGDCCKKFEKVTSPLIVPLKELPCGQIGKVSYINTQDREVLKKLIAMGIQPGSKIKLLHRFPSFVFEMGTSCFAIDKELAENIYVLLLKSKS